MRVNEIYASVQGEGPNTGKSTVFVRFGGCNLRCPGWGSGKLPDGTVVQGCDTIHAVYPAFRDEWAKKTPLEIVNEVMDHRVDMVTLTGGEPLLQKDEELHTLVTLFLEEGLHVEMFTNGSKLLPQWWFWDKTSVVMDYKLPGSGEGDSFNKLNWALLRKQDIVKFVCKDPHDLDIAIWTIGKNYDHFTEPGFSLGVVWNSPFLTEADVAQAVTELANKDVTLNIQTHKHIWDPKERKR